MPLLRSLRSLLRTLVALTILGLAVGLACLPLNLLDRAQDQLLHQLPGFGGSWQTIPLLLALSPVVVMPLLLLLQAGPWRNGAGSGIPQTMESLEQPSQRESLLGPQPTLRRLVLWSVATLSLMPLGREGPVVQVGAAVAHALQRRWPRLLSHLKGEDALAIAAAAGLAGGFNTPFMAVIFLAEELTKRFAAVLIWPAMLVAVVAAQVSNLGGQGLFALGILRFEAPEAKQLLLALPLGVVAGLLGALFGRLLLEATRRFTPLARRRPLLTGLGLGLGLAGLAIASGGLSGGDGEAVMEQLIQHSQGGGDGAGILVARLIGPCLALGAGIPGGLIDPALAIGAVFGKSLGELLNLGGLGLALGMTASLAGATQLPAMSVAFALRLAGDQQLLPGMVLAAVLGAYISRLLLSKPIYHALAELGAARQPTTTDAGIRS